MSFITSGVAVFSVTYVPAVTGLTASNPQETTVDLAWIGARSATSYSIVSTPATTTQTTSGTSYTFTGLSGGTSYTFTVTSVGAAGSGGSTTSSSVITLGNPLPEAVTNFVASNPQETTVDLVWDPALYATSYSIESSPPTTTQTTSDTFITFIELTPNTEYTFTITPTNATGNGPPTTSDPISTLLPLPGVGPSMGYSDPPNPTATTMDLAWFEYVPEYATSFNVYAYSVLGGLIGFVNVPISSFSYTYTGLTPGTEYYFTVAGVNATGVGEAGGASVPVYTLIQVNLAYTGTIETLELIPGNYNFQMAGGSGPLRSELAGGAGRCFAEYTFLYTVENTITIQYAIGQASPGDVGGAGGTYIYDQTNSQWLFVAGGAGTNDFSPNPAENAPGDGSGGVAGSGGGSGAGVNSNGSASTVSAGSGGLTFGNGGTGGAAGTFGDSPQPGGFGGGGGGTLVYDPALPPLYGEYAYYPGGGGGYTGGTTDTAYTPEVFTTWFSGYGTSYMIPGSTLWAQNSNQGSASVTNGYININP